MERRVFERINMCLPVKYLCGSRQYSGTVHNISEIGMYISTDNFLPCQTSLEIIMPVNNEIANFRVEIRRIERINDSKLNIGVELADPPGNYLRFIESLKAAAES